MAGIDLSWTGGLARLRLAEPGNRNAFNLAFCRAFAQKALDVAAASPAAILIEAEGDAFSVGGDLAEFLAERERIERHVLELASLFHLGIARLHGTGAPILVAVNGTAAGGGFSLVCGADLVVASEAARFVSAYTASGVTPDGGGTFFLPRIVGRSVAFDLMATNPVLSAQEAKALGIVARVVAPEALDEAVEALVAQLAAQPPGAVAGLKALLRRGEDEALATQLRAEADSIARLAASPATLARMEQFLTRKAR